VNEGETAWGSVATTWVEAWIVCGRDATAWVCVGETAWGRVAITWVEAWVVCGRDAITWVEAWVVYEDADWEIHLCFEDLVDQEAGNSVMIFLCQLIVLANCGNLPSSVTKMALTV
jgi:hypothetical protein